MTVAHYITDVVADRMEEWLNTCEFGRKPDYDSVGDQHEAFVDATKALGLPSPEAVE